MTIGEFFVDILVRLDENSVKKTKSEIDNLKKELNDDFNTIFDDFDESFSKSDAKTNKEREKSHKKKKKQNESDLEQLAKLQKSFSALLAPIKAVGSALGVAFSLDYLDKTIDRFERINYQLRAAADGINGAGNVVNKAMSVAENTYSSYPEAASAIKSVLNYGYLQYDNVDDAADFVEKMNKMFRAGGALNSQQSNSMTEAVASSMRSGKISPGAFNQILENAPRTLDYLAKSLGKTYDQVYQLGRSGLLMTQQLIDAYSNNAEEIEEAFKEVPYTIKDAMTFVKNDFGQTLTKLNEQLGITDMLAKGIKYAWVILKAVIVTVLEPIALLVERFKVLKTIIGVILASIVAAKLITGFKRMKVHITELIGLAKGLKDELLAVGAAEAGVGTGGAISGVGGAIGGAGALLGKVALIAAAIAAIFLIVDDIRAFIKGEDSIFGKLSGYGNKSEYYQDENGLYYHSKEAKDKGAQGVENYKDLYGASPYNESYYSSSAMIGDKIYYFHSDKDRKSGKDSYVYDEENKKYIYNGDVNPDDYDAIGQTKFKTGFPTLSEWGEFIDRIKNKIAKGSLLSFNSEAFSSTVDSVAGSSNGISPISMSTRGSSDGDIVAILINIGTLVAEIDDIISMQYTGTHGSGFSYGGSVSSNTVQQISTRNARTYQNVKVNVNNYHNYSGSAGVRPLSNSVTDSTNAYAMAFKKSALTFI